MTLSMRLGAAITLFATALLAMSNTGYGDPGICPIYGDYEWDGQWLYYGYECSDAADCPVKCDLAKWGGCMWFTERLPVPYCADGGNCDVILRERGKKPGDNHDGHTFGLSKHASREPLPFRGKGKRVEVEDENGKEYRIILYNVIDKTQKKNIRVMMGIEAAGDDASNFPEIAEKLKAVPNFGKYYRTLQIGDDVYQIMLRGTWE